MAQTNLDHWAQWMLHRRHGGDPEQQQRALLDFLYPVRDRVLRNAALEEGDTLLDVGAGDGLIAFGALGQMGERGKVIFSDVSQDLLDHSRALAAETGALDRCEFVRAPAEDLSAIGDSSVDAVTTRSVLIFVKEKQQAFEEFYRVLRRGGRLSIFEPINSFGCPRPQNVFWGYDVTPVMDIARKVRALYESIQPPDTDPMTDFDERDLLSLAEKAGFGEIHLELQVEVAPTGKTKLLHSAKTWKQFVRTAPNPKVPTLEEAMSQALTPEEAERFAAHLRPLVGAGQGTARMAVAYLWAVKL